MGMFDEVRCLYPLPNKAHQDLLYQTKDLECLMDEYVITRRGRLVRTKRGWFAPRSCHVACPIHQDLRIYDSIEVGPDEREWVEYVLRFTEGRVTRVRRSRDRGRFKVQKWKPEDWKKPAEPAAPSDSGTGGIGLVPALHPRRATVVEYSTYAPEKLELIDGHIPGEENLLLLLLTSMGLRRAARLVGPELWRSAAAPVRWHLPRGRGRSGRRRR